MVLASVDVVLRNEDMPGSGLGCVDAKPERERIQGTDESVMG